MRYTRGLISFVVIAMVVGLSFLAFSADQAKAQDACLITIGKAATPEDDTPFTFVFAGNGTLNGEVVFRVPTFPSNLFVMDIDTFLTVTEQVPEGWELAGIECTQGTQNCGAVAFEPCLSITIDEATNSITATCLDNDQGSCTFTNVLAPVAPAQVPTLSEWGLISMAGVLGLIAFAVLRRKKAAA